MPISEPNGVLVENYESHDTSQDIVRSCIPPRPNAQPLIEFVAFFRKFCS